MVALLLKDWTARWTMKSRSVGSRESAPRKCGKDREKPGPGVIVSWDL